MLFFPTDNFDIKYGMGFGWFVVDYQKYRQSLHTVSDDHLQARLLTAANEGQVDEVVGLLARRETHELNEEVSCLKV